MYIYFLFQTLATFSNTADPFFGVLLGHESEVGWHVTGCCCFTDSSPNNFTNQKDSISQYLSGGKWSKTSFKSEKCILFKKMCRYSIYPVYIICINCRQMLTI